MAQFEYSVRWAFLKSAFRNTPYAFYAFSNVICDLQDVCCELWDFRVVPAP